MNAISLDSLDLAALLCSRVCHDVISPVGAIVNALEVLEEDDPSMRDFALELIKKSARNASARLQFARLAFGAAEPWGPLRSLFADRTREAEQTRAFRQLAGEKRAGGNLILVTHGANIVAFVGVSSAMAEMVIVTPQGSGAFTVAGRLPP